MSASLEYLQCCSAETGFPVAGLEKVVRLGEMAAEVGRHPWVKQGYFVKCGGPASPARPWNSRPESDGV